MNFKHGIYRHFKGHSYRIIGLAKHSETLEEMIVYVNIEDSKDMWVRPISMFTEMVQKDGISIPRFQWIGEE